MYRLPIYLRPACPRPSVVRMKLFTLDHRFIIAKGGMLASKDRKAVTKALEMLLGM